jgi:maltooligosyltrehalose synthase
MRIPMATYRLQFNSTFGFKAAKDIVPYLAALGISDIYASPIFQARAGSAHGYDVVDHNKLNPELGGREDFLELIDFRSFQRNVAHYGIQNSLSQTLLKIASPGIPDFYQGTELWDLSLVDPDNRRAVDFGLRKIYLEEIKRREDKRREDIDLMGLIKELLAKKYDGRIKLFLIHRALMARITNADLFRLGAVSAHKGRRNA